MPIVSDKHVINISFKHIDSLPDGQESSVDVHAFLEDGIMKVRLKVAGKMVVVSISCLQDILDYLKKSVPALSSSTSVSSADHSGQVAAAKISNNSGTPPAKSSLESLIFGGNPSGVNGGTQNESGARNYASPTIIAASLAVSAPVGVSQLDIPVNPKRFSTAPEAKKIRRKNSLNLAQQEDVDEDGRIVIDLTGEQEPSKD
jgi:hypothetical protein